MSWDPSIAATTCPGSIWCIGWSPCSRFIAISFSTGTEVHLLDAVTLKRLKSSKHPHHPTDLLTFSPESRSLIWFSYEPNAFTSWDLQTGVRAGEIPTDEPLLHPLSVTYSGCGTMVGVLFKDRHNDGGASTINIYDLLSRTLIYRHPIEGRSVNTIWRHGDCVQFAIVGPGSITVWEVGFSSQLPPTQVESLPTPNNFDNSIGFLFHPTPPRLASEGPGQTVAVWDARYSKLLLNSMDIGRPTKGMSFSTDGHLFACEGGQGIYLWKESPTGYIPHRKLVPSGTGLKNSAQFFSPNGQSTVTTGGTSLQLWRTTDSSSSTSSVPVRDPRGIRRFIIRFSPDGLLAAVTRERDDTAIVFDLKSGATRLTVDTGATICALGVARNTIAVVVRNGEVVTWNLPTGVHVLSARAGRSDSVRTTRLGRWIASPRCVLGAAAISPGLNYVAAETGSWYYIHDGSTGVCLGQVRSYYSSSWFTADGRELWFLGSERCTGWAIVRDGESDVIELEPLDRSVDPSGGFPWQSPHGCQVTNDWWVLNSTGKRLLWLPPHWRFEEIPYWRSEEIHRVWSGRFLALLHAELPEVVVLELLEE